MGNGLVFLNNLGQLVRALGGEGSPAVFVSIFSVMSCGGRLLFGWVTTLTFILPRVCLQGLQSSCLLRLVTSMSLAAGNQSSSITENIGSDKKGLVECDPWQSS